MVMIFSLDNSKQLFANAGLGIQQFEWKLEDDIATPYDDRKISYSTYITAISKSAVNLEQLYPN